MMYMMQLVNDTVPDWTFGVVGGLFVLGILGFWTYKKYFARKD